MRGGSDQVRDERARIGLCSGWTRWMSGGSLPLVVKGDVCRVPTRKWALRRSGRRGIGRVTSKGFGLGCVVIEGDVCLLLVPREQDGLRSNEKGSGGEEVVVEEKCRSRRSSG